MLQLLRCRVGAFKGEKSIKAAVSGYSINGTNLLGLANIHTVVNRWIIGRALPMPNGALPRLRLHEWAV